MPKNQTSESAWVPLARALEMTGLSERTLRRYAETDRLRRKTVAPLPGSDATVPTLVYHHEDLARIVLSKEAGVKVPQPGEQRTQDAIAKAIETERAIARRDYIAAPAPAAPERDWITSEEAARLSGLPVEYLEELAAAGAIRALNVTVRRRRRPEWRFFRGAWREIDARAQNGTRPPQTGPAIERRATSSRA